MQIINKTGGLASLPSINVFDVPDNGVVDLTEVQADTDLPLNFRGALHQNPELFQALASGQWRVIRDGVELDLAASVADSQSYNPPEIPSVTSSATATAQDEGTPITYTATSDKPGAQWRIIDDDGTGVTIDHETGVMTGGELAAAGAYTITIQGATNFGPSLPFEVSWTVNPFVLGSDTMFGTAADQIQNADPNMSPAFPMIYLGQGCVAWDGAQYVVDRTGAHYANALDFAIYASVATSQYVAFRTDIGSTSITGVYGFGGTATNHDDPAPSPYITLTTDAAIIATLEASPVHGDSQPWGDRQTHLQGSPYYLEITPSGGVLDEFLTDNAGWSYGFTLLEDWICTASAMQMLTPISDADGAHLFGISTYWIGTTMYDRISYGDFTWGPYSTSVGVNLTITDGLVAAAGTQVQVRFDGTTYRVYFDGVEVVTTTSPVTYMQSVASVDPVIGFGYLINEDLTLDEESPAHWAIPIEDLWLANSTAIDAADLVEMSAHSGDMAASANYGDVDVYCQFAPGSAVVVKGTVTLARGSQ